MKTTIKTVIENPLEPKVPDLTFYSLFSVLQGGMWLLNDLENFLKKYHISYGRFAILLAITDSQNNGIKPVELANVLGKSKPTISKMLKKLHEDGFIKINQHQADGRSVAVSLLKKGQYILNRIIPEYNRRILKMSAQLVEGDMRNLINIIAKIQFYNPYHKVVTKYEL